MDLLKLGPGPFITKNYLSALGPIIPQIALWWSGRNKKLPTIFISWLSGFKFNFPHSQILLVAPPFHPICRWIYPE